MIDQILGKKVGMTQVFSANGRMIPVTVIQAGPCTITQIKTQHTDGYDAIQLGFAPNKRINQPEKGHLKGLDNFAHLREVEASNVSEHKRGDIVTIDLFTAGDRVDVVGTSKGKGFAGGVKRHHFRGGPKTHGQSDRHRAPGSIGSSATPGRVYKGTRMAGRMGHTRVTVQDLVVVTADAERNLLVVKGAVPGARGGLLMIRRSIKTPVY